MKTLTIGRSSQCDIIVPHNNVSRIHARLSIVGGKYVYEDLSKHGSVIGGRVLKSEKIIISPGTEILLAGHVPLPWGQVYNLLPLQGGNIYDAETLYHDDSYQHHNYVSTKEDESIAIGWGILAFFIPLAGWIMYFIWKDDTPKRASQANTIAWIGFALNLLSYLCLI